MAASGISSSQHWAQQQRNTVTEITHANRNLHNDLPLAEQLLATLDSLFGVHPGFRPAHAKGLMCSGTFTPSPEAARLTRAPHAARPSTSVTVRYSDSPGLPTAPDNDPQRLRDPRGFAVRFDLADHVHTDIVAHSFNGFPVHTGEQFGWSSLQRRGRRGSRQTGRRRWGAFLADPSQC